jgi:hypothetical protein
MYILEKIDKYLNEAEINYFDEPDLNGLIIDLLDSLDDSSLNADQVGMKYRILANVKVEEKTKEDEGDKIEEEDEEEKEEDEAEEEDEDNDDTSEDDEVIDTIDLDDLEDEDDNAEEEDEDEDEYDIEESRKLVEKKTTHKYKGYTMEWDNENEKVKTVIKNPKGKVIFEYAKGSEPTISGFNKKVDADIAKNKK